jgi:hypothetical protein
LIGPFQFSGVIRWSWHCTVFQLQAKSISLIPGNPILLRVTATS